MEFSVCYTSEEAKKSTVDSDFNELGYNEIFEFLNIHFFITDLF